MEAPKEKVAEFVRSTLYGRQNVRCYPTDVGQGVFLCVRRYAKSPRDLA